MTTLSEALDSQAFTRDLERHVAVRQQAADRSLFGRLRNSFLSLFRPSRASRLTLSTRQRPTAMAFLREPVTAGPASMPGAPVGRVLQPLLRPSRQPSRSPEKSGQAPRSQPEGISGEQALAFANHLTGHRVNPDGLNTDPVLGDLRNRLARDLMAVAINADDGVRVNSEGPAWLRHRMVQTLREVDRHLGGVGVEAAALLLLYPNGTTEFESLRHLPLSGIDVGSPRTIADALIGFDMHTGMVGDIDGSHLGQRDFVGLYDLRCRLTEHIEQLNLFGGDAFSLISAAQRGRLFDTLSSLKTQLERNAESQSVDSPDFNMQLLDELLPGVADAFRRFEVSRELAPRVDALLAAERVSEQRKRPHRQSRIAPHVQTNIAWGLLATSVIIPLAGAANQVAESQMLAPDMSNTRTVTLDAITPPLGIGAHQTPVVAPAPKPAYTPSPTHADLKDLQNLKRGDTVRLAEFTDLNIDESARLLEANDKFHAMEAINLFKWSQGMLGHRAIGQQALEAVYAFDGPQSLDSTLRILDASKHGVLLPPSAEKPGLAKTLN